MQTIDTSTLKDWMEDPDRDLTVVNVLDRDAYETAHIPGTGNIPLSRPDFEEAMESHAGSREAPIVVYCASEDCDASPRAARRLDEAGFETVYDYEGGTAAWRRAGHELERAEARTG